MFDYINSYCYNEYHGMVWYHGGFYLNIRAIILKPEVNFGCKYETNIPKFVFCNLYDLTASGMCYK